MNVADALLVAVTIGMALLIIEIIAAEGGDEDHF